MDDEALIIEIGVKLTNFQKSMSDATSGASKAFAAIEARGVEAAKKLDAGFATVGKSTSFQVLGTGLLTAEKNAGALVSRLKEVNDKLNAVKGTAATGFASGQGATASGLLQSIMAAGSLKNFAALSGGALGVGAIAAGVVASQTKQLADLQQLANEARVTAAQMAGLQAVFGKLGVSSEATGQTVKSFAERLLDAQTRGGDLANSLNAAGVSIRNADGSLRPVIDVLSDLTRFMHGSSDEAGNLKLAAAAVGDQLAGPFVAAIKQGGSALDNLQVATNRVGSSITNDLAAAAASGMKSLDALWARMNQVWSRAKEIAGLNLSSTDQLNVAESHVREAQGHLVNLQMAQHFRDVSPDETKAAYQRLFDAGKELAEKSPVRVLSGTSPGEKAPAPPVAPAAAPTKPAADADKPSKSGGGRARASSSDDGDDKSADVIAKLRLELQLAQSTGDAHQRIADQLKIEAKLKEAGVEASSAEGKMIADLVRQTDAATTAAKAHNEVLKARKETVDLIGSSFESSLEDVLLHGAKLNSIFQNLAETLAKAALQAALLGQGPLAGLFGGGIAATSTSAGGLLGGLVHLTGFAGGATASGAPAAGSVGLGGLTSLGSMFSGFADGGMIKGAGTGTSDSIVARVSHGEFIVNADAAKSNVGLLTAMNAGKLPRFATGGAVGAIRAPTISAGAVGSPTIHNAITVNGSAGTPAQNADLAKQMTAHLETSMRGAVTSELQRQMRSGNMLAGVPR